MSDVATAPVFQPAPLAHPQGPAANRERERARAQGYVAGHAAGVRAAVREARVMREVAAAEVEAARQHAAAQQAELVTALEAAVRGAQARADLVLADAQATLFAAAVELASAIVGRELTEHDSAAVAALQRVTAADAHPQTIRMHPADAAIVQTVAPAGVQVVADERVARGDAFSEHPEGYLDASVTAALARAVAAVQEVGA